MRGGAVCQPVLSVDGRNLERVKMERGGHDGRVEGSRAKAEEKDDQGHNHKLLQYSAFLCVCMWGGQWACVHHFVLFFLCDLRSIPCVSHTAETASARAQEWHPQHKAHARVLL